MKKTNQFLPIAALAGLALAASSASAVTVTNPNFDPPAEDTSDNDANGYGDVSGWTRSGVGVGVNTSSQPFLNQTAHSGSHAVFMQGSYSISQPVSGFDPTKLYTVTYFVSERG